MITMTVSQSHINILAKKLASVYSATRSRIESRIAAFQEIRLREDTMEFFEELVFCILTPQSRPRMAEKAIATLKAEGLLFAGDAQTVAPHLSICRFKNGKARSVVAARELMHDGQIVKLLTSSLPVPDKRMLLARTVRGIGLKEASHLMRNTGCNLDAAILDRHVLRFMVEAGLYDAVPGTLTPRLYDDLEARLYDFSRHISIPMEALDFVIFYIKTGEIYK